MNSLTANNDPKFLERLVNNNPSILDYRFASYEISGAAGYEKGEVYLYFGIGINAPDMLEVQVTDASFEIGETNAVSTNGLTLDYALEFIKNVILSYEKIAR